MGHSYMELERYEEARNCYKKAVELDPNNLSAKRNLKALDIPDPNPDNLDDDHRKKHDVDEFLGKDVYGRDIRHINRRAFIGLGALATVGVVAEFAGDSLVSRAAKAVWGKIMGKEGPEKESPEAPPPQINKKSLSARECFQAIKDFDQELSRLYPQAQFVVRGSNLPPQEFPEIRQNILAALQSFRPEELKGVKIYFWIPDSLGPLWNDDGGFEIRPRGKSADKIAAEIRSKLKDIKEGRNGPQQLKGFQEELSLLYPQTQFHVKNSNLPMKEFPEIRQNILAALQSLRPEELKGVKIYFWIPDSYDPNLNLDGSLNINPRKKNADKIAAEIRSML